MREQTVVMHAIEGSRLLGDLAEKAQETLFEGASFVPGPEQSTKTISVVGDGGRRDVSIDCVSPATVAFRDSPLGFVRALFVRDPDGHLLRVTQP